MKRSTRSGPIIVAHRGLHDDLPENSIEAFDAAWRAGLKWCECDVRFSRDDIPVSMHDATLDRTTARKGPVVERTWKELSRFRLRDDHGKLTQATLPSLQQLIQRVPPRAHLLVEIKPIMTAPQARRVLKMLSGISYMLQSFRVENMILLRALAPRAPLTLLLEHRERLDMALAGDWQGVNVGHTWADRVIARRCRDARMNFGVWTVNTRKEMDRIVQLNPDILITDRPDVALQATNRSKSGNNRTVNRVADRNDANVRRRRKNQNRS